MTAAPRESPQWFLVRANAIPVPCYQCQRPVYLLRVRYRRVMVDCGVDGGSPPDAHTDGRGVHHAPYCTARCRSADPFMAPGARIARTTP